MKSATLSLMHPVLFVMDFRNDGVTIPDYSRESIVSASSSCVSVRVMSEVDGEVTILLATGDERASSPALLDVFEGEIATPTRRLAVVTSENEAVLQVDVPEALTTIRVQVDDLAHPGVVHIGSVYAGQPCEVRG